MKRIFKYAVTGDYVLVPKTGQFLHIDIQDSGFGQGVMAWYLVDEEMESPRRDYFFRLPTGGTVDEDLEFISTEIDGEGFVWHWFRRQGPAAGEKKKEKEKKDIL